MWVFFVVEQKLDEMQCHFFASISNRIWLHDVLFALGEPFDWRVTTHFFEISRICFDDFCVMTFGGILEIYLEVDPTSTAANGLFVVKKDQVLKKVVKTKAKVKIMKEWTLYDSLHASS